MTSDRSAFSATVTSTEDTPCLYSHLLWFRRCLDNRILLFGTLLGFKPQSRLLAENFFILCILIFLLSFHYLLSYFLILRFGIFFSILD